MDVAPVEVRGAFELDRTPAGLLPKRLPAWTRPQIPDLFMGTMVDLPSGVRVTFRTDSPVVELDVHTRALHVVPTPERLPVFQLTVDGVLRPDAVVRGGSAVHVDRRIGMPESIVFEEGSPCTLRWDDLGDGESTIAIWLPTNASVELRALRIADGASLSAAPVAPRRWTHYGSSISHCMDVDRPFDAWPVRAAAASGVELTSFAFAGQCQLDPFMGRVIGDHPADVISLKLGINLVNAASMTERTFTPAVHGLLDTIRERQPDTPILVVSPIFCPSAERHPGPTMSGPDGMVGVVAAPEESRRFALTLEWVRAALEQVVTVRRALGDVNLHHLSGLTLLGTDEGHLLYDALHPSPRGYALMADRFVEQAGWLLNG